MKKKKIVNVLTAAVIAYGYGILTYLIFFFITDENLLISTILNAVAIIVIVVWDRIENRLDVKTKTKARKHGGASVKSGFYFFYIIVLMCTALLGAEPDLAFFE